MAPNLRTRAKKTIEPSSESELGGKKRSRKKGRIASKKIVVIDQTSEQNILAPREPEFKGKVVIHDDGHAVLESEQVFMCDQPGCNSLFTSDVLLRRHLSKHNYDIQIQCEFCKVCLKSTSEKSEHLEEFHPDLGAEPEADPLQCKKCGKICTSAFQLKRHILRTHGKEKYVCRHCGNQYATPEGLHGHLKIKHDVEEGVSKPAYPCEICGKVFLYSPGWRKHIWSKHRDHDKGYKCVICKTVHFYKSSYRNHMLRHTRPRSSIKSISCGLCNTHFRTQFLLKVHLETLKHKKVVANYQRQRRNKTNEGIKFDLRNIFPETKTLEELKQMKTEELFQFCSQRVVKIVLHRVDDKIRVHLGCPISTAEELEEQAGKIFYLKCVYCHKPFPNLKEVKSHENLCTSERANNMHTCSVCNKSFNRPHLLTKHSITHSTERPYKCHYCDKFFKKKDIRLRHEKSIHFGVKFVRKDTGRTFTCPYEGCGKQYGKNKALTQHVKTIHMGVKFPCKDCGKSYPRMDVLKLHEHREHPKNPELIVECKPCNKSFAHIRLYRAHARTFLHLKEMKEFEKRINQVTSRERELGKKEGR